MKLARYFVVGGVAALVDWSLFWLFVQQLTLPYQWAAALSFVLATLVNYVLSIRYVFESGVRYRRAHEMFFVYVVSAIGLLVNLLVLQILFEGFGIHLLVAKVGATGVVFFWNYLARSRFIFRSA